VIAGDDSKPPVQVDLTDTQARAMLEALMAKRDA